MWRVLERTKSKRDECSAKVMSQSVKTSRQWNSTALKVLMSMMQVQFMPPSSGSAQPWCYAPCIEPPSPFEF